MIKTILAVGIATVLMQGCNNPPNADQVEHRRQETLSEQANMAVGMPNITHFAEKKMLKDIYELRDKTPPTYVYIVDMNGKLHKVCDAVGYGFSGATQFTNPQQIVEGVMRGEFTTIAQSDPNGLYSPATDEGTWVMCKNPKGDNIAPVRIEPRAIISPFELN